MKDAQGVKFEVGDKLIYCNSPDTVSAAEVIAIIPKGGIRVRVISKTAYGTKLGAEVVLGKQAVRFGLNYNKAIIYEKAKKDGDTK